VLADRLADQPVVLVTVEGADGGALDEAAAVLDLAGARTITTITVQPEIVPDGGSNTQELAKLLGLSANSSPSDLMAAAADALAGRLAETAARAGAGDDLLGQLLNGGFVVAPDLSDADLAEVGGAGQVIVVVGGASAASQPATQGFLTPLVGDLIDREMTTAAAEGSDRTSTFVSSIIDAVGSTALVTVDGLDQAVGGNALVLGIAQALETGEGGAFGVGDQMSQPLPPPPA
jgi:Copper transport outer membrane protein, MctB